MTHENSSKLTDKNQFPFPYKNYQLLTNAFFPIYTRKKCLQLIFMYSHYPRKMHIMKMGLKREDTSY